MLDVERFKTTLDDLLRYDTKIIRLGDFHFLNYSLWLNCNYQEYQAEHVEFVSDFTLKRNMRTFFHELTHYFQSATTPFGQYLSMLADFQILQLIQLVKSVSQYEKPTYPLLKMITGKFSNTKKYDKIWYHLKYFFLSEVIRLYFSGGIKNFAVFWGNTIFRDIPISECFLDLEHEMQKVYHAPVISRQSPASEENASFMLDYALRVSGPATDSVFENHARISEYWWEGKSFANPFSIVSNNVEYTGFISEFSKAMRTNDFHEFVATFSAICELSLFAPVLPHMAHLNRDLDIRSLNPAHRMRDILSICGQLESVKGLGDYKRFIDETSNLLSYPPIDDMLSSTTEHYKNVKISAYQDRIFLHSQHYRKENFSVFYNLGLWHPHNPFGYYAKTITENFVPPFIQYNDKVLFHRDKNMILSLTERFLLYYYLKELLIGYDAKNQEEEIIVIESPYIAGAEEAERLESFFYERIKLTIGDCPPAKIVSTLKF